MSTLRVLLALSLLIPAAAFAAIAAGDASDAVQSKAPVEQSGDYRCCWVFTHGMWYCIPC